MPCRNGCVALSVVSSQGAECLTEGLRFFFLYFRCSKQKTKPLSSSRGVCMKSIIVFGTLGSGSKTKESEYGSRHLFRASTKFKAVRAH